MRSQEILCFVRQRRIAAAGGGGASATTRTTIGFGGGVGGVNGGVGSVVAHRSFSAGRFRQLRPTSLSCVARTPQQQRSTGTATTTTALSVLFSPAGRNSLAAPPYCGGYSLRATTTTAIRALATGSSSGSSAGKKEGGGGGENSDGDDTNNKEIVLTPGEKVVAASRLTLWAGIAAFASVCAYYIGSELIPTYVAIALRDQSCFCVLRILTPCYREDRSFCRFRRG